MDTDSDFQTSEIRDFDFNEREILATILKEDPGNEEALGRMEKWMP